MKTSALDGRVFNPHHQAYQFVLNIKSMLHVLSMGPEILLSSFITMLSVLLDGKILGRLMFF